MPDTDNDNQTATNDSSAKPAEVKIGLLTWLIMITLIAVLSGSGYFVGRLFAVDSPADEAAAAHPETGSAPAAPQQSQAENPSSGTWYYRELEPVVVNPDEPGATRFVRVGLILEISNELGQEKAIEMIQSKTPLLVNWLNLYFKSLSLDQMENERDMKRILSHICDEFNGILFPDAKPQIKNVLIREFNIQ